MKDSIAKFWLYFSEHKAALEKIKNAEDPAYDNMLASLQEVHEALFFQFCTEPGKNEFIITAEGEIELFPLVDEIVTEAPPIANWTIFALKPQHGFPVKMRWESTVIDVSSIRVLPVFNDTDQMGLRMYIPNLSDSNEADHHNGLLQILDSGLGERRFAEKIAATWVYPESETPDNAIPITDLNNYIDHHETNS